MSLPEPNFIDRDVDAITREWIALYEEKTGKTLQPAQIERILIDVGVYRENLLRIKIQETAKQNLVNYASYPVLDYLGELVGVYRIPSKPAKTTIRFNMLETQTFNVLIPTGVQVESKDGKVIFKTLKSSFIPVGQTFIDIEAECEITGTIGNGYLPGEVKNFITPVPYIENAENITETSGGAEAEENDPMRERIKQAPEKFSNAGSRGAYTYWAMTAHQDIIDVSVINASPGVVKVYPLTKSGNPNAEILTQVQNILSEEKTRPLTDLVLVEVPEQIDFEITANLILYTYADIESVQAEANEKIKAYIANLKSKLGRDIVPTQIISLLNSIYGVYRVELITPFLQVLDSHQWANCTVYMVNIGGYVNG
ncbi:MAG TPA: baseplate J/gp47 family protein [Candidatus Gastranaerophilales bacterium]|nr:baseplate J/gp47 family protein [Candidatus Gastranaerophilales bacterium]